MKFLKVIPHINQFFFLLGAGEAISFEGSVSTSGATSRRRECHYTSSQTARWHPPWAPVPQIRQTPSEYPKTSFIYLQIYEKPYNHKSCLLSHLQSLFDFMDICRVVKPNTYRLVSGLCYKKAILDSSLETSFG